MKESIERATFAGAMRSENNRSILLKFGPPAPGYSFTQIISIPVEQAFGLASVALSEAAKAQKDSGLGQGQKLALTVDWWEFGSTPDQQTVSLTFRMQGGSELTFQVHRDAALHMRDVLSAMLGGAETPPPEKSRH